MPARGLIATSSPYAVEAGLDAFASGGNAADAALAAAAALTVTEPTGCGLGADAFALVSPRPGEVVGLDASGRSPAALTCESVRARGHDTMPHEGWLPVTVPGVVSGWDALHARFGRLRWERLLAPAIDLAREGFAVSPFIARQWQLGGAKRFAGRPEFAPFAAAWLIDGERAPRARERFRHPDLAATLEHVARHGADAFYEHFGERIEEHARATGGLLTRHDCLAHRAAWVTPIEVEFAGARVFELPPSGQGIVAALALAIAEGLPRPPRDALLSGAALHRLSESLRQAIAIGARELADPAAMRASVAALLAPDQVAALRARIAPGDIDRDPGIVPRADPGTVYLAAADAEGLVVSFIQSNYMGFGSGIVIPGTGISMQNRGAGFVLDPFHPNAAGPRKKPFHTIIPGFYETSTTRAAFGVMGGPMQPQGHVQILSAMLEHGCDAQAACAMPRFRALADARLAVEDGIPEASRAALVACGYELVTSPGEFAFGGAQVARFHQDGRLDGGSDPRKDGFVGVCLR